MWGPIFGLFSVPLIYKYDTAIPLQDFYPRKIKTYAHYILMTNLFIIVPSWKQPKLPITGDWINKLCYINTTEF